MPNIFSTLIKTHSTSNRSTFNFLKLVFRMWLKEQCHISRIFFPFFLAILQTSYGFSPIKTFKSHYFYQKLQIAAKSLLLQRLHPASIFAFSRASNTLFTK